MTSLWSFVHQHKDKTLHLVLGLIIFAAGLQLGRVTSPYYAAHPIVFEEREPGGNQADLVNLKEEGIAPASNTSGVASDSPEVKEDDAVAGATQAQGQFVGSINSDLFHELSCPSVSRILEANQIWFASIEEAEAAGYKPSKCTQERLNI